MHSNCKILLKFSECPMSNNVTQCPLQNITLSLKYFVWSNLPYDNLDLYCRAIRLRLFKQYFVFRLDWQFHLLWRLTNQRHLSTTSLASTSASKTRCSPASRSTTRTLTTIHPERSPPSFSRPWPSTSWTLVWTTSSGSTPNLLKSTLTFSSLCQVKTL